MADREQDDLGPVVADFDDPSGSTVSLVSYHYDALMRFRRLKLCVDDTGDTFFVVPVERDGQLLLERQPS